MDVTVKGYLYSAGRATATLIAGLMFGYTNARADTILWAMEFRGGPPAPFIENGTSTSWPEREPW